MMKQVIFSTFAVLGIGIATSAFGQVKETPATIGLAKGGNPRGFIQGSDASGITFSTAEGQRGNKIPYSDIRGEGLQRAIILDERDSALEEARASFSRGDYETAAEQFSGVARNYAIILNVPNSFALEAFFYELESLRRAGKYAEMAPLAQAPVAKNIGIYLDQSYQRLHEFQKLWALLGGGKMAELKTALESYQVPATGQAKLLSEPNFKDLPPTELVELAYLRGKVYESEGEKSQALDDYYRVFTLTHANNPMLAREAMTAALGIQKEMGGLSGGSQLQQMQSLAYAFGVLYEDSLLPDEFKEYAVMPELPDMPPPAVALQQDAEKAGEGGEAKPAEAAEGEGKKGKAEEGEKGKGGDKPEAKEKGKKKE